MTYAGLYRMKSSAGLNQRLIACAAQEGIPNPDFWVVENLWAIVSNGDWVDAWQYAEDTATVNHNPDVGARDDVINDAMILSSIQAVRAAA